MQPPPPTPAEPTALPRAAASRIASSLPRQAGFMLARAAAQASQFVSGSAAGIDYGINRPAEYSQANPDLVTSVYTRGDNVGTYGTVVSFANNAGADAPAGVVYALHQHYSMRGRVAVPRHHTRLARPRPHQPTLRSPCQTPRSRHSMPRSAPHGGLAWDRTRSTIYAAAFLKRFAAYGTAGPRRDLPA